VRGAASVHGWWWWLPPAWSSDLAGSLVVLRYSSLLPQVVVFFRATAADCRHPCAGSSCVIKGHQGWEPCVETTIVVSSGRRRFHVLEEILSSRVWSDGWWRRTRLVMLDSFAGRSQVGYEQHTYTCAEVCVAGGHGRRPMPMASSVGMFSLEVFSHAAQGTQVSTL